MSTFGRLFSVLGLDPLGDWLRHGESQRRKAEKEPAPRPTLVAIYPGPSAPQVLIPAEAAAAWRSEGYSIDFAHQPHGCAIAWLRPRDGVQQKETDHD